MSIEYDYSGVPDFNYLISELQNPAGTLRQFQQYLYDKRTRDINAGVDPYGVPYTPLSPRYAAQKQRKYPNKPILVASGRMRSLHRISVNKNILRETYPAPAVYHQSEKQPRNKLPRRALVPDSRGLPEAEVDRLVELVTKAIERGVNQANANRK